MDRMEMTPVHRMENQETERTEPQHCRVPTLETTEQAEPPGTAVAAAVAAAAVPEMYILAILETAELVALEVQAETARKASVLSYIEVI